MGGQNLFLFLPQFFTVGPKNDVFGSGCKKNHCAFAPKWPLSSPKNNVFTTNFLNLWMDNPVFLQEEKEIFSKEIFMAVTKKPDLSDPVLRAKLAKGMGHNYYGEPAWPNDLLYIFPVVIFGTFACVIGLSVLDPAAIGEPANPFATPLEILPEWYFYPVFQILRVVPNKLLGVLLMAAVPAGLLTVPFIENINKFQNPFRRPVATTVFLIGTVVAIWLGIGAALPIDISLTLGLF